MTPRAPFNCPYCGGPIWADRLHNCHGSKAWPETKEHAMSANAAPACPCVPAHSPIPLAFQTHHVVPRAWHGPDVASNRAVVCGTAHDNIHHGLDAVTRTAYAKGRGGTITPAELDAICAPYTPYTQSLIRRAVTEVGPVIPHVYTLSHPGEEHPHDA